MKPNIKYLSLSAIQHDVSLTPSAHEVSEIAPDKEKMREYERLEEDFSFSGCPLVWETHGQYLIAGNYELVLALRQYYHTEPTKEILCLVISDATKQEVIEFSHRASFLGGLEIGNKKAKPHFRRLLVIRGFIESDPDTTYEDIKRVFSIVGKSRTPLGEQIRKDYYLAKSDVLMCGLLGVASLSKDDLKPDLTKAIYRYEDCVNRFIPEFNLTDDEDVSSKVRLAHFDKEYREYCEEIKARGTVKQNLAKPIFKREQFSKLRFEDILKKYSGHKTRELKSKNASWVIESTDTEIIINGHRIHKKKNERENIQKHVDGAYKSFIYGRAERSFLKRAGPVAHGERMRTEDSINNLEFESYSYFEFIRRYKVLYYCDPVLLLKSIKLRPSWLGFESSDLTGESTYSASFDKFTKWYEKYFKNLNELKGTKIEKDSKYEIYRSISGFLKVNSIRSEPVDFDSFIQLLFKFVFTRLDDLEDIENKENNIIRLILGDADVAERKKALESLLANRWNINESESEFDEFDDFGFGSQVKGDGRSD